MKKYKTLSLLLCLLLLVSTFTSCVLQETETESTNSLLHSSSESQKDFSVNFASQENFTENSAVATTDMTTDSLTAEASVTNSESDKKNRYPTLPKQYWVEDDDRKFGEDVICVWMQPSDKIVQDYKISDFPEIDLSGVWYTKRIDGSPCIMLILSNPSKENVISGIRRMEQREDIYKATPEYDTKLVPVEIAEDATFFDDRVLLVIQPSARQHTYTAEDFPELDCASVEEHIAGPIKSVRITLKQKSKDGVVAAVRLLEKREDLMEVRPSEYVLLED